MKPRAQQTAANPTPPAISSYFTFAIGLFLVLTFLKWGSPIILAGTMEAPEDIWQYIYHVWPIEWAFWGALPVVAFGIVAAVGTRTFAKTGGASPQSRTILWRVGLALPAIWLGWELLAATQTVNRELTSLTLRHFVICVAFFYFAWTGIQGEGNTRILSVCLTMGMLCVLSTAFDQHFGGLEATRRMIYQDPNWKDLPPALLKKIGSDRVFGTMGGYPNALAGLILLVLPIAIGFLWQAGTRFSKPVRVIMVGIPTVAALACLYWSGSKAGWLLALVEGVIALWLAPVNVRWKRWVGFALVILGLAGFGLKYAGFFKKGSTSVVARFEYWKAALHVAAENPLLGSGPGTYSVEFSKIKPPEAEMARLCHNDYLEQAADSGIPGSVIYTAMVVLTMLVLYRRMRTKRDLITTSAWLGLLGLTLHSFVEFHLYVPALSWPMFVVMGWAWGNERVS